MDMLNLYQICFRREYYNEALNEPTTDERFGLELDIIYHPAITPEEAEIWFKEKGVKEVNRLIPGAKGAVLREIKKVYVDDHTVVAIPDKQLLEARNKLLEKRLK